MNPTPGDGLWAPRGPFARALVMVAMLVNLAASLGMAFVLRDATAAGGDTAHRMAYIGAHPTLVAVVWYLWIPASMGLMVVFFTLLRAIPGREGLKNVVFGVLLLGAVPDILNNLIGAIILPEIASRAATASGPLLDALIVDFVAWDRFSVGLTGVLGNAFYALAGYLLIALTARTPDFPRPLVWIAAPMWTATLAIAVASIADSTPGLVVSVGTTMVLFCGWCTGVAFLYLGRTP